MKAQICFSTLAFSAIVLSYAFNSQAQVIGSPLVATYLNPSPAASLERFGAVMATLDSERFVVSSPEETSVGPGSGAAYLFHTNGSLLMTFTNPTATVEFGSSLTTAGSNQILIGAPYANEVYLFNTNGAVTATFTNPLPGPNRFYGSSITVLNDSTVAIGSSGIGLPTVPFLGAVFFHAMNGTLIGTIPNPYPNLDFSFNNAFGADVAAVGADRIIVTAPTTTTPEGEGVGSAYLFHTNGALLCTFTNPTPAAWERFGANVLVFGAERILISANDSNAAGAAYLFDTNGVLLQSFFSPDPAPNEFFGSSLAALGDLILIGAPQDSLPTGPFERGAAYIFKTNGTFLKNLYPPSIWSGERFGCALAAVRTNQIFVGAERKISGSYSSGGVYQFSCNFVSPPAIRIETEVGGKPRIRWPMPSYGFILEKRGDIEHANNADSWILVPPPYQQSAILSNGVWHPYWYVTETASMNAFYRLRQP